MIGRRRDFANRPIHDLSIGAILAVCALAIVLGAVILGQIHDPDHARRRTPTTTVSPAPSVEVTNPTVVSYESHPSEQGGTPARMTPHDGGDIRTSTRRFLTGYLRYADGRGEAIDITNATHDLVAQLEHDPRARPGTHVDVTRMSSSYARNRPVPSAQPPRR